MNISPARSNFISIVLHAAAIALVLLVTGARPPAVKLRPTLFTPVDLLTYKVNVAQPGNAGGGGGMHAPTPASLGNLPRVRKWQDMKPAIRTSEVQHPLIVEPTILGDERTIVEQVDLGRLGDPHGVPGPPSQGPGKHGGLGTGDDGGDGSGHGPGAGKGGEGGVESGNAAFTGAVTQPVLLYKAEPEYSEDARKVKLQGVVVLRAQIDARGHIQNIVVTQPLGLGLDERAIEAVRKWRFRAGMQNGKAVAMPALIQVSFRLL